MNDLLILLQQIKAGKTSFTPRTSAEEDLCAFQSLAKALLFADEQGYLDGFLPHKQSTTRHGWYDCVLVKNGLSYLGQQFLEQTNIASTDPISADTRTELLEPVLSKEALQSVNGRHIGARVMQLLQLYEAEAAATAQLKAVTHEQLICAFNQFVFHHGPALGIKGWADNIQSLRDGGVDATWHFASTGPVDRFGLQLKSWGDIEHAETSFRRSVMAQITESRQMKLSTLFLALAGDLTNRSQSEKVRGLMADIHRLQDDYVYVISPEKIFGLWQWSQRLDLNALDQVREAGYAVLTVIYDTLGNRNQNSWGKRSGGVWSHAQRTAIRAGDTVGLSAVAVSPGDQPPEYHFAVQRSGRSFETRQDWAPTPDWEWHVTADDIGKDVVVKIAARRKKSYYQFHDCDDYTYAVYDVLPQKN
jgi:hypothetical protein